MAEIKFRGKVVNHDPMTNPENGWVEGYYLQDLDNGVVKHYIFNCPCCWEVIPESVGQFTGLHDKNGKEIYEGDVIKVITFGFDPEKFIIEIKYGCSGGVLGFHLANGRSLFYFGQSDYSRLDDTTIIGNIHDNPELLSNDEHDPGASVN